MTLEEAAGVVAAPFWSTIENMAAFFNFLGTFVMTMINATVAMTIKNMVDFSGDTHTATLALCAALFAIILWAVMPWPNCAPILYARRTSTPISWDPPFCYNIPSDWKL